MDGKQLKNSILQWAIQGKLVPQNPKDEPASKLLERLAAIRHSEQSEESSKRSKKTSKTPTSRIYRENGIWYEQVGNAEPKDISEDIPFDIPENWAWCRLGNVINLLSGRDFEPQFYNDKQNGIPYITGASNIGKNGIIINRWTPVPKCIANYGDLLLVCKGSGYGTLAYADFEKAHIARQIMSITVEPRSIFLKYVELVLQTNFQFLKGKGKGLIPGIDRETILNILAPLPPLAEQKRIVARLEQVLPLVDEYGAAQEQLDKLNKELPEALKKSILQQAIQGKLVPQNPKDEPAQKLLERIASSRHSEQSEESSKRSKKTTKNPTSRIYCENGTWYEQIGNSEPEDISDEIPFDIPTSWAWCRLGDIFDHKNGKQLNVANKIGSPRKYITTSNLYWDHFVLDNLKTMYFTDDELDRCTATKGDLLVCEGGDIGRAAIWNEDFDICIQNHIHKLRAYVDVCTKYFWNVLYFYKKTGMIGGKGIGIQGLSSKALHNIIIPLPPLAEQKRIVTKLEQLFKVL